MNKKLFDKGFAYFAVLGLFNVVSFENNMCNGTTTGLMGVCYTMRECQERGGSESGSCAAGFGVCCICGYFRELDQTDY